MTKTETRDATEEAKRALYFLAQDVRELIKIVPSDEICRGVVPKLTNYTLEIDWELDWVPRKVTLNVDCEYGVAVVECVAIDMCQWGKRDDCRAIYRLEIKEWNQ